MAAWLYEIGSREGMTGEMMTDHQYDAECLKIDLTVNTPRPDLDKWWRENFDPCTGQWIHNHPEHDRLEELCRKYHR